MSTHGAPIPLSYVTASAAGAALKLLTLSSVFAYIVSRKAPRFKHEPSFYVLDLNRHFERLCKP